MSGAARPGDAGAITEVRLRTDPRIPDPDAFYEALMEAHRGLDEAASRRLDARLVLLLANHIGDQAVLMQAIAAAREDPDAGPGKAGGA